MNENKALIIFFLFIFITTLPPYKAKSQVATWDSFNVNLFGGNIQAIAIDPDNPATIYIGILGGGFFYSENGGDSWFRKNESLECWEILSLLVKKEGGQNVIYAGTMNGLYLLKDLNSSWKPGPDFLENQSINLLSKPISDSSTIIYAGYGNNDPKDALSGFLLIINKIGENFSYEIPKFEPIRNPNVYDLLPTDDPYKFDVATDFGYFKFSDLEKCSRIETMKDHQVFALARRPYRINTPLEKCDSLIFAGTDDGGRYSTNDGLYWPGDKTFRFMENNTITVFAPQLWKDSTRCYAGTLDSGVFSLFSDDSMDWNRTLNNQLPNLPVKDLVLHGNNINQLFAGNSSGIYYSDDGADNFISKNSESLYAHRIHDLIYNQHPEISKKKLFAAADGSIFYYDLSENSWEADPSWALNPSMPIFANISCMLIDLNKSYYFAGTDMQGLLKKDDFNKPWYPCQLDKQNSNLNITVITTDNKDSVIYTGTSIGKIFKSIDEGKTWEEKLNLKTKIVDIRIDLFNSDTIYISAAEDGTYKYDGVNITYKPSQGKNFYSLAIDSKNNSKTIFAGTNEGIFYCQNPQNFSWIQYPFLGINKTSKLEIARTITSEQNILYFLGGDTLPKIYRHILNPQNCLEFSEELPFYQHQEHETFCIDQENPNIIYLGTNGSGVYKYEFLVKPLEGTPIEIKFGDVPQGSPNEMSYQIKNPNGFMPLQVTMDLEGPNRDNFIADMNESIFHPDDLGSLVVTFFPKPPHGLKSATLKITCGDIFEQKGFEKTFSIPLSGIGRYGDFDIDTTDSYDKIFVKFDSVHVDSEKIVKIKWENFGNVELFKENIDSSNSIEFSESGFPDCCVQQSSDSITLSFKPTSIGAKKDSVKINYYYMVGQKKIPCHTKVIILEGVGVQSIFVSKPSTLLDFKKVPVGSWKEKILIIENGGNLPIIIDTAYIASCCDTFEIKQKPSDIIFTEPQDSFIIKFGPEKGDDIVYYDTLIIIHKDKLLKNSKSNSIVLTGIGIDSVLLPTPPFIVEFGQVHLNDFSETILKENLELENLSPEISSVEVYDLKNETNAYIVDKLDSIILLNDITPSKNIPIIFRPNAPELREYKDSLYIYYIFNSDSFYTKVKLHAEVVSGKPEVIPTCLRFDKNVHVDSSREDSIALKNSGNIPIYFNFSPPKAPFELVNLADSIGKIEKFSEDTIRFRFSPIDINPISRLIPIKFCDSLNQKRYLEIDLPYTLWGAGADAIACFPDSFRCPDTQVGNRNTFSISFSNIGNIDMLNVESWCDAANFQVVPRSISKVEPNKTDCIYIQFSPDEFREYASICSVRYTDSFNVIDTVRFFVNGKGWGFYSMGYNPDPIVLKQPVSIWAKVRDNKTAFEKNMTRLRIRKGGETTFDSLSYSDSIQIDSETTKFNWELPGEWITSRGVEYYFEAFKDTKKKPAYYPYDGKFNYFSPCIRIPDSWNQGENYNGKPIPFHLGNQQNDYRLISIPVDIDNERSSVAEILKHNLGIQEYDEYLWRCAEYYHDIDTSYYIYLSDRRFSNFTPGKSFFLILHKGIPVKNFSYPSGYTITTDTIYNKLLLTEGWNLIANPFNFPVPLNNMKRSTFGKVIAESLLTHDKNQGWKSSQVDTLYPWTGYALYTNSSESLFINPDLGQPYFPKLSDQTESQLKFQWSIFIDVSCQTKQDINNVAGTFSIAMAKYDQFDRPEPPPIGDYVMLTFPHPEWNKAYDYFTVDVQPPNSKGNVWDFSVCTNILNSEVKLNFKNLESVPENFQVMLICEHLNYIQDLRKIAQFVFNSSTADESYPFRIVVGEPDFVRENKLNVDLLPKDFKVTGNFPNPFNGSTTIGYELPDEDAITICIYNVLGELIKTLEKDNKHDAGKYFMVWDGTNESGTPTSSGIYFCKFISNYQSKTFKMVLIR